MMDNDNVLYDVWLSMALRSCSIRLWNNIEKYGGAKNIYEAFEKGTLKGFEAHEMKRLKETTLSMAQEVIEHCCKKNYEIITYDDDIYPELLREIYNPPLVLYCYGRIEILKAKRMISIVGTRKPSGYSTDVARRFCSSLVNNKFVIISGFALGIDSVAHGTALKSGGYSVAVIGCGLDYPYPKENFYSRENFIKRGLIISEFIPTAAPEPWCFPHRNRILSGMSMATLVIEAGANSGSLVTANLATEQGRDVFCIPPHDIFDNSYSGNAKLLKNGAIPAFSYSDILEEYSIIDMSKIPLSNKNSPTKSAKDDLPLSQSKSKAVKVTEHEPGSATLTKVTQTDDKENLLDQRSKNIVSLLKKRDMLVDELCFESGLDMAELFLLLTELEISGFVECRAGNIYSILK